MENFKRLSDNITNIADLIANVKPDSSHKRIKFSHAYKKLLLANGEPARWAYLLDVIPVQLSKLDKRFLRYDTDDFKFHLPYSGDYILLLFQKELTNDLFTTLRKAEPNKVIYYRHARGEIFKIEILPGK